MVGITQKDVEFTSKDEVKAAKLEGRPAIKSKLNVVDIYDVNNKRNNIRCWGGNRTRLVAAELVATALRSSNVVPDDNKLYCILKDAADKQDAKNEIFNKTNPSKGSGSGDSGDDLIAKLRG